MNKRDGDFKRIFHGIEKDAPWHRKRYANLSKKMLHSANMEHISRGEWSMFSDEMEHDLTYHGASFQSLWHILFQRLFCISICSPLLLKFILVFTLGLVSKSIIADQIDGHDYVDLGLPSGTLWATVNYGAILPEKYGTFYNSSDIRPWGNKWVTPSKDDFQELIDECEWTWANKSGKYGYQIRGTNGNTMFLPSTGYYDSTKGILNGDKAYYYSSTKTGSANTMWLFYGSEKEKSLLILHNSYSFAIRPISTVKTNPPVVEYNLTISSSGNGTVSFDNHNVRNSTNTFTVNKGASATITFSPDTGYRIKTVIVGSTDVTNSVSNNQFTITDISGNTTMSVEFEAIPKPKYILTLISSGNGEVIYNGSVVRSGTCVFSMEEGSSALISFSPDNGNRIKSVKVGTTNVTSSVSNNQYTISNISADTTIEVEFEEIPVVIPTYTLTIKASGNGSVSYGNADIRNTTKSFTLNEGTSATISFTPDDGYQIKDVKVNGSTISVSNNEYTINGINKDTSIEVEFEAKEPEIDIAKYISVSYSGGAIIQTNNLINSGSQLYWTFSNGSTVSVMLKSLQLIDGQTGSEGNKMAVDNVVEAGKSVSYSTTIGILGIYLPVTCRFWYEFNGKEYYADAIYTGNNNVVLTIKASGAGVAEYNGSSVRNQTSNFNVEAKSLVTITFTPDNGCWSKDVKVDGSSVTISNNQYTISSINKNTTVEVEFVEKINGFESGGINYSVVSESERTVNVADGNYGIVLEVPAMVSYREDNWTVVGIDNGALSANTELAAIIWNPDAAFTEKVDNPNLLLYVKSASYAPATIKNVVVNGSANSIVLSDASGKNNFYCPQEFTAKTISYTHNYKMETGLGSARGWETIALPFDVQKISHQGKGEIVPFANWKSGDSKKPFWLMTYGNNGWTEANSIKANTAYIISMPNHSYYKPEFRLSGNVTFSAENVTIPTSGNIRTVNYNGRALVPNYINQNEKNYYALNVNNDYVTYSGNDVEGSKFFIGLRAVHPFEAYMISASQARMYISIDDDMTTGIGDITEIMADEKTVRVYNLNGQLIMAEDNKRLDEIKPLLSAGVYIVNGKKIIIR